MYVSAAFIAIGNELLSGRTQDTNLNYLAKELTVRGINILEARFIRDDETSIITNIQDLSPKYTYVFTSGGIGPTHDDITSLSISKALNLPYTINQKAYDILQHFYTSQGKELNTARLKMTYMPENANLIANSITAAPGFIVDNIYVMAGIPSIFKVMVDEVVKCLIGGDIIESRSLNLDVPEGVLASDLSDIQALFNDVEIGSYPQIEMQKTSIVMRSSNINKLEECFNTIKQRFAIYLQKVS